MAVQQVKTVRRFIDLLLRRKLIIITLVLLGATAGLGLYLLQPKVYQSTSLLIYQQQKVSPANMSPEMQGHIRDIVSTISQIVTSRTNLERIINDVGLYRQERRNMPMEDVIERMRANIVIRTSDRGDTFHISFMGSDPRQVVRVANALAAGFIDENLKYREERASDTSAYIADELERAKTVLDRKEMGMRDYKLQYYNEMPEQRATNVARLIALQGQHQSKQESIQDLERTRILIQDQIAARKQLLESALQQAALLADGSAPPESNRARLQRLRSELPLMLKVYTEQHPRVIHAKKVIAWLEQAESESSPPPADAETADGLEAVAGEVDQIIVDLQLQLKSISLNIDELIREKETIKNQIEQYEQWVAAAPVREAEWSSLTREYGELKRHYDFLVSQNLQARSALNLERTQKGSQFKIEDPARLAEKPVKPNFLKIMAIALFFSTVLGGALALVLEFADTSFNDPDELRSFARMEVVCTAPLVALPREKRREMWKAVVIAALYTGYAAALAGGAVYLWSSGRIII